MKDYVFIGWSRNRDLAIAIKEVLDKCGFIGVIGGIYEGNPAHVRIRKGTVNETINYQMNHCDQSILLFQKIDDNLGISGNLIYELGYINAQYNFIETATKLHIFKIDITKADDNLFPSDLHGIWGTNISSSNKSITEMADEIVKEFLSNQSQNKKSDKFKLLNNHYYIEYEMKKHFNNPTMSDYDLATALLVYVQSAFCYQEQNDIKLKFELFKAKMIEKSYSSRELEWVTNYAIQTLTLYCLTVPNEDSGQLCMPGSTFRGLLSKYKEIGEYIGEAFYDELGSMELSELYVNEEFGENNDFEAWLIAQMQEHVTYLILVYLCNSKIDADEFEKYARVGVDFCLATIKNLELLAQKEDGKMYANLLLSYAYKNLCTFYGYLHEDKQSELFQRKSFKLRKEVYSYANSISTIKPSLKDYLTLEYLLQVVDKIKTCEDKYEKEDYLLEINTYIDNHKKTERNRNFMFNSLVDEYGKLVDGDR